MSSKIEQENLKFGAFDVNGVNIPIVNTTNPDIDKYFNKFLDWLFNNVKKLKRLHLLGGETFIQHRLMEQVLAILEQQPNPNLEFCVFSNFNVPDKYWNLYISRIKDLQASGNIKRFDLTASIDCWGPQASYVRSGLNLDKFEERLDWAAQQSEDWLYLNVNQTITSMTIKTMPELVEKVNYYSKHRFIGHHFQFYVGSQYFQHPEIFAYSMWEKDFERIFSLLDDKTLEQKEVRIRMLGIQKQLQQAQSNNYTEIKKLKIYLDELDRRRNTDWRALFPYLDI